MYHVLSFFAKDFYKKLSSFVPMDSKINLLCPLGFIVEVVFKMYYFISESLHKQYITVKLDIYI